MLRFGDNIDLNNYREQKKLLQAETIKTPVVYELRFYWGLFELYVSFMLSLIKCKNNIHQNHGSNKMGEIGESYQITWSTFSDIAHVDSIFIHTWVFRGYCVGSVAFPWHSCEYSELGAKWFQERQNSSKESVIRLYNLCDKR